MDDEGFDFLEAGFAEVVFDSLDVFFGGFLIDSDEVEEFFEDSVTVADRLGDLFAPWGEGKASVFLVVDVSLAAELLDHAGDTGTGEMELAGDIGDPGEAFLFQ